VLHGDPDLVLTGVAPLETAGPAHLSFLARPDYRARARESAAGCLILGSLDEAPGRSAIVAADPYRAFALAMRLFHLEPQRAAGVHDSAVVSSAAEVAADAHVGPLAVVSAGSRVGARTSILAGAVVGEGCVIGSDCVVHPGAVLYPGVVLGDRVMVHARAVIGSDGFGYASGADGHLKIPHAGRVVVEDDVEIGAGTCIDRAAMGETRIGRGTKIDNLVQVAHNVRLGAACLLVAQSGIAGSATLGDGVVLAGQSGVAGHLRLGDGARVAAKSAVLADVPAGEQVGGIPAIALPAWRRAATIFARLPDLLRRLQRLERQGSAPPEEDA